MAWVLEVQSGKAFWRSLDPVLLQLEWLSAWIRLPWRFLTRKWYSRQNQMYRIPDERPSSYDAELKIWANNGESNQANRRRILKAWSDSKLLLVHEGMDLDHAQAILQATAWRARNAGRKEVPRDLFDLGSIRSKFSLTFRAHGGNRIYGESTIWTASSPLSILNGHLLLQISDNLHKTAEDAKYSTTTMSKTTLTAFQMQRSRISRWWSLIQAKKRSEKSGNNKLGETETFEDIDNRTKDKTRI